VAGSSIYSTKRRAARRCGSVRPLLNTKPSMKRRGCSALKPPRSKCKHEIRLPGLWVINPFNRSNNPPIDASNYACGEQEHENEDDDFSTSEFRNIGLIAKIDGNG
jgi:hypothetical protein